MFHPRSKGWDSGFRISLNASVCTSGVGLVLGPARPASIFKA